MDSTKEYYYQTKNIDYLKNKYGKELWVQVSGKRELNNSDAVFWAALIPVANIEKIYKSHSWDSHIGTQAPCFVETGSEIMYHNNPLDLDSCENIVNYREFYGIKPDYVEIVEEFRLLNNLFHDIKTNQYFEIADNGECVEVARIENNTCTYIRLKYLMRYASAKQMALLLFFDIRTRIPGSLSDLKLKEFSCAITRDSNLLYSLCGGEIRHGTPFVYSVLMGKKFILPKPIEECGYWPYQKETGFADYIIGVDEYGEPQLYTSNPDKLANNFGANPDAPHYLTPVFFKKEVLQKYLSHPDIYGVEDGYLRCQSLWSMEIDNHHKEYVSAYLGDLGKYLPAEEQLHWKHYNVATDEKLSEVSFKRDFLGMFTEPEISDLKFKSNFRRFQIKWEKHYQWQLFLPLTDDDVYNLELLHLPITGSQEEFDHLVLSLVKSIIDSLNEKEIVKHLKNTDNLKGGISKLERWLFELALPDYEVQIKFLRNLQELRSTGTGHRKGHSYERIAKVFGLSSDNFIEVFDRILIQANDFISFLAKNLLPQD